MLSNEVYITVRYGETDQMGVVHHGVYDLYYEIGRTELLKEVGFSYKEMEKQGIMLPVKKLSIEYMAPAYYDEKLRVTTKLEKMPGIRVDFIYEVFNEDELLLNRGYTQLVFVDAGSRRPIRPPQFFIDALTDFF